MDIVGLGLDLTGTPLSESQSEEAFDDTLVGAIEANAESIERRTVRTTRGTTFRGEQERRVVDAGDPREAGWTFLVNANDPDYDAIVQALRPPAQHRGMANPDQPLIYSDEPEADWLNWLYENWYSLELENQNPPQYILIVGGADQIPFFFQSLLDTVRRRFKTGLRHRPTWTWSSRATLRSQIPARRKKNCAIGSDKWLYFGINPMSGTCDLTIENGIVTKFSMQFDNDSMSRLSESLAVERSDLIGTWRQATGAEFVEGVPVHWFLKISEDGTARWAVSPEDLSELPDSDHVGALLSWAYDDLILTVQNKGPATEH